LILGILFIQNEPLTPPSRSAAIKNDYKNHQVSDGWNGPVVQELKKILTDKVKKIKYIS
jgi:hypothetical protein